MEVVACPPNSIIYNQTLCTCAAGYLLNQTTNTCDFFNNSSQIYTNSGVDSYSVSFPATILSWNSIRKFTQSQALFLEATFVALVLWLIFCFSLRLKKLNNGDKRVLEARWWISRLDICFSTKHWLDDQKPLLKRKTELGGTFSIASWILFIGLCTASLYHIIFKRSIEFHNVRALSSPELSSFMNDMEFNITTLSSMSCSNINSPPNMASGSPGMYRRQLDLTKFVNFTCHNTSFGPKLTFKCSKCQLWSDIMYISFTFVDAPTVPATAVGFEFNLSSNGHMNKKHVSIVGGTLKNTSIIDSSPVTYRGRDSSMLKFNLFPQIYHKLKDLKLIQPLFHDFIPGSFVRDNNELQRSLQSYGMVEVTLLINVLSSYVVEIDKRNLVGPVSFFAEVGGLYSICIGLFWFLLVHCEYKFKKFRFEDASLKMIRSKTRAQENWDKLRKYVAFTWGITSVAQITKAPKKSSCFSSTVQAVKNAVHFGQSDERKKTKSLHTTIARDENMNNGQSLVDISVGDGANLLPPLPEFKWNSPIDLNEMQSNFQKLCDYNAMLREKLMESHNLLNSLVSNSSTSDFNATLRR